MTDKECIQKAELKYPSVLGMTDTEIDQVVGRRIGYAEALRDMNLEIQNPVLSGCGGEEGQ